MTTADESSAAEAVGDSLLSSDAAPKLDLALKEGETIKINITVSFCDNLYHSYNVDDTR